LNPLAVWCLRVKMKEPPIMRKLLVIGGCFINQGAGAAGMERVPEHMMHLGGLPVMIM
jgi:hypothetical protein